MAHQQLPTRHFRHQSPAMDHFPEDQQSKQAGLKMLVQRLRQMGNHTGLRHQSPTGTSRRALGRTSENPIQTRVIGPGPHPGRCEPLLPVTLNSTPTTSHSPATQFLATSLPPISRCPSFHPPVLPNRRRRRTSFLFLATRTASAT